MLDKFDKIEEAVLLLEGVVLVQPNGTLTIDAFPSAYPGRTLSNHESTVEIQQHGKTNSLIITCGLESETIKIEYGLCYREEVLIQTEDCETKWFAKIKKEVSLFENMVVIQPNGTFMIWIFWTPEDNTKNMVVIEHHKNDINKITITCGLESETLKREDNCWYIQKEFASKNDSNL